MNLGAYIIYYLSLSNMQVLSTFMKTFGQQVEMSFLKKCLSEVVQFELESL